MKILVLCLPGIGDALMATPLVKELRKKYPKATIDVLCMFKGVEYVFRNNPYIDNVYFISIFSDTRLKALYHLWPFTKKRYDVSILTFPEYRKEYNIVQFLIFAKKRISHKFNKGYYQEFNFLNTHTIPVEEELHNLENNINLLRGLNIEVKPSSYSKHSYDLILDKSDEVFGVEYLKKLKWNGEDCVAIHPGSIDSKAGLYKRWPTARFVELGKAMIKKHNKKVIIFCGPSEMGIGRKIQQGIHDDRNCHLVENAAFGATLGILKQCRLIICNDNGFAHLSNALKVKSIVMFGPTNPQWCSPYNKKYSVSIRNATFTPWFRNDMKVDNPPKNVTSGMDNISVTAVLKEVSKNIKL